MHSKKMHSITAKNGEKTHMLTNQIFRPDQSSAVTCPYLLSSVEAGFPSPAEDYVEGRLDLNQHLIKHPAATFFVRVSGDSMINAGIYPGDILIVDRSLEAADKKIVIAVIDGELTVKRLRYRKNHIFLEPENDLYLPIAITKEMAFDIWGVVTNVIHKV